MVPLVRHIYPGASHAIEHMLGPMGVGHGETSCILLPTVCKYNAICKANIEQQQNIKDILCAMPVVKKLLVAQGLKEGPADLIQILNVVICQLGMPRSLQEVGVGLDRVEELAVKSLKDPLLGYNPAPISTKEEVMEILQMCA